MELEVEELEEIPEMVRASRSRRNGGRNAIVTVNFADLVADPVELVCPDGNGCMAWISVEGVNVIGPYFRP
jgi:hypothetical protein